MSSGKKILFLLLLLPLQIFAQGISNLWMMGYDSDDSLPIYGGTNINFFTGLPDTSHVNRVMNFHECNANISDSNGNLLFYTNGVYIANANNDTMVNGDNLNPSDYTSQMSEHGLLIAQANFILPLPGDSNIYYLFHETVDYDSSLNYLFPLEIYYSIIDMSLDGGLGAVTQKNKILLSDTLEQGAITGCKHANGRDWWLIFHKATGNRYFKYLLSPTGLHGPYTQDIGYSIQLYEYPWQSCFSPDGNKFAEAFSGDSIQLLDFDRCTGNFSNDVCVFVNDSEFARGIAFSPNSQLLYLSSGIFVYQYNLTANNIDSSRITLGVFDGFADPIPPFFTAFFLAQLANDGKIYINTPNGTRRMHVINNPDVAGYGCNFVQHQFLLPTYNGFTIPNFPNYFLGPELGTVCDRLVHTAVNEVETEIVRVFPNPAANIVYVSANSLNEILHTSVKNIFGETVRVEIKFLNNGRYLEINMSALSSGIYFLELSDHEHKIIKKIIKE